MENQHNNTTTVSLYRMFHLIIEARASVLREQLFSFGFKEASLLGDSEYENKLRNSMFKFDMFLLLENGAIVSFNTINLTSFSYTRNGISISDVFDSTENLFVSREGNSIIINNDDSNIKYSEKIKILLEIMNHK